MRKSVLVLGGTGTLGVPVVRNLTERDHSVSIPTRSAEKTWHIFGESVDALEGAPSITLDE
jgi:uncharacterized protein YbjT (DUF2867 family)